MSLDKEFDDLQQLFAQKDLLTEPIRSAGSGFMEILLLKRKNMKIKIYQEKGHQLPHIHIDYGKKRHTASYSIDSGQRIKGELSKKYDSDVSNWLKRNRKKVLEVWDSLQVGMSHEHLLSELSD
ncbi:DUF4160 domain-containing protein [Colwellia sp. MB02u-10]|uniref:DUF4160 domain-containing protein n=1 Tax=Colwellia sp. MB02u-10 TaxID=2759828 RepID=UPI0015F6AF0F|nr:DUF4160 domain-containing protein [Colwellia sp. MB02u-10]MBA6340024.1 DUF4160 domain-containing protein [Colwellia sp. MB02u-10]